ncbi:hypothetical protein [Streptomyces sp. CB01881]|uniref:hypothetical protein n=1 Tax=Streptomyces sp. CB01881 TaxID=2078691 RepID=UPI000CDCA78D|nr:hypothetical protein [Streptomyces sp. CB01881]AUY52298.1 hypothetical protein C2142_29020 [Streptomyces sp. CB01881]TYC71720.1 hypothetical protein EH183_29000 [Streptomyces sp. CB01881]
MKSFTKAGLAAGATLLLAACSGGGSGGTDGFGLKPGKTDAASTTASPTRTPTPTPTPTRPPYGPVLAGYIDPVNTALGKLNASASLDAFSTALQEAATAATKAGSGLGYADEPATVTTARRQLVVALGQLSTDLTKVRNDIRKKNVCATTSAFAEVGQSEGLKAVPAALAQMNAAGYPTTFNVPQTPQLQTRSQENGTLVREGRLNGSGVLNVDNGGSSDAVVSLAQNGKSIHSVYVGKGKKASIEGVEDGTYDVYFAGGVDWDPSLKAFTQSCDFSKFDDTMAFETGRTYTSWSITLQPTVGGNAKTSDVDEDKFPEP